MKAGPDFEQAGDAATEHPPPLGRFGDAAEDLQERALARAIATDDADDLALLDSEDDILERPELIDLVAREDRAPADDVDSLAREIANFTPNDVAQRRVPGAALTVGLVPHQI